MAPGTAQKFLTMFLLHVGWLLVLANVSEAVIVFEKGKEKPTKGYLIRQTAASVTFDELLPNGRVQRRVLPMAAIEDLIVTVSEDELKKLHRDDPDSYRVYADELSAKPDPDAQLTALRLYLIAAYLEPTRLGRGCLLSMADLARSPAERRRFRAMVYLLDPDHDRSILEETGNAPNARIDGLEPEQRKLLLDALTAVRGGEKKKALNIAKRSVFRGILDKVGKVITDDELKAAAEDSTPGVPKDFLRRVLLLELALHDATISPEESKSKPQSWGNIAATRMSATVRPLSLESITEFDPRACHFQSGKWVAPTP